VKFESKIVYENKMEMCQDGHLCPEKRDAHKIFITHCDFKKDFQLLMPIKITAVLTAPSNASPFVLRTRGVPHSERTFSGREICYIMKLHFKRCHYKLR